MEKSNIVELTYKKIWKTRGARFAAHSNYLIQNKYSNFTIGILSTYVFALSLAFLSPSISNRFTNGDLNLVTLISSLILIVFSQLESSKDYKLKADKLHRNAMELSDLCDEIQILHLSEDDDKTKISKTEAILKKYNIVIQKCDENHNKYDYDLFLLNNANDELKLGIVKLFIKRSLIYFKIRIYFFLWLLIPILFFFLVVRNI